MKQQLITNFYQLFNRTDGLTYFSPARVNLIGEHIDYNGGYVFPCALSIGTYGIIGKRNDNIINVSSHSFGKMYQFSLDNLERDPLVSWADYIKGVIVALHKRGYKITHGFDLYIHGNMPYGAGLSSSASLESLIVVMLDDMFNLNISLEDKALIGQDAENNFVGVNSGIMDQFAVLAGKKNHAIMLNTNTLEYKYVPLELNDYRLLIVNTNKKRGLADSKYNERYKETRKALSILKPIYLISNLCELKPSILPQIKDLLDDVIFKRVRHVVTEQDRTIKASNALINHNLEMFGELMIQSHESLKNDYDVTGIELDTLQSLLMKHGALGARMTGAGFGGSCVAIVNKDLVKDLTLKVLESYKEIIGYEPSFIETSVSDGTHKF
ncbi:galactokinase [Acholeplasma granularum]|uniref:galactokinase n=1 Tax=Acholeplasma granularum TaxID=264635 RepID=UPI000471F43B|nr:galactokinase [Acholeplasma granularum]